MIKDSFRFRSWVKLKFVYLFMAIFLCNISNAQVIKHDLLGLNMDLDWYTLTNYSAISYFVGKSDTNSSWVVADCDYHLKSVDIELESLMFTDYVIAFSKSSEANGAALRSLSPLMFVGRYIYDDVSSFNLRGFKDAENLKKKISRIHGEPILTMDKPEFKVYKWQKDDYTIIVNSVRSEKLTSLNYMINSR